MTQADWPARLTQVIAGEVRRYRQEQKMSAQQLADRTAQLGMPIARSVLANLESGRRESVSAAEILILAAALNVPPGLLLFPVGRLETMDVLPGCPLPPWDAFMWLAGERDLTRLGGPLTVATPADHGGIQMFRSHDHFRRGWTRAWWALQNATKGAGEASSDEEAERQQAIARNMTATLAQYEDDLRILRRRMRDRGLVPPSLPDELADLDESSWNLAVTVIAELPGQVAPISRILRMGRPVLLDLRKMAPADRAMVSDLLNTLLHDLNGTVEALSGDGPAPQLTLTPGAIDWHHADHALASFAAALEAHDKGRGR